jgi:hypothetical protein
MQFILQYYKDKNNLNIVVEKIRKVYDVEGSNGTAAVFDIRWYPSDTLSFQNLRYTFSFTKNNDQCVLNLLNVEPTANSGQTVIPRLTTVSVSSVLSNTNTDSLVLWGTVVNSVFLVSITVYSILKLFKALKEYSKKPTY